MREYIQNAIDAKATRIEISLNPDVVSIRDNGTGMTAKPVREWLDRLSVKTLFIEPGRPCENGYLESFNGKVQDEVLNVESFDTLFDGQVLVEGWRKHYHTVRPHSSLGYRPPAPEARQPWAPVLATLGPPARAA